LAAAETFDRHPRAVRTVERPSQAGLRLYLCSGQKAAKIGKEMKSTRILERCCFLFLTAQRDKKRLRRQTGQNEQSDGERPEWQPALVRTVGEGPSNAFFALGRPPERREVGPSRASAAPCTCFAVTTKRNKETG
jgi:hypothetical protein